MRSERTEIVRRLKDKLDPSKRFVDLGAQLRVWRRSPAGAVAAELIPKVYGGRYDRLLKRYVGPPQKIEEISCHAGQLSLLTFDEPGVARVLALGAPGGGKTFAAVRRALLNSLDRPNSIGGLVAPTNDRRQIVWRDFMELVAPFGWIDDASISKKEIILANRTVIQVLAAKRSSAQYGNPLQGRSWDWCVVDESQNVDDESQTEIDTRGRRAGIKYIVFETATNAAVPSFRVRLEQYKQSPLHRVIRYQGLDNPWTEAAYWERLRGLMSEREYREKVLAQDVPPELLVYPEFEFATHVMPRPKVAKDVTPTLAERMGRENVRYIAAQDFGVLTNATIILKAFQGRGGPNDRLWWAIDEITTYGTTADVHAARILEKYDPEEVLVVADPHMNTKDSDKSDYHLFQRQGLHIVPAAYGRIRREHRISMMRSLLRDKRFFIDCDDQTKLPYCKRLVQSFSSLQRNEHGEAERDRKDRHDLTHWTAAAGYGVFPWEKIRGSASIMFTKVGT